MILDELDELDEAKDEAEEIDALLDATYYILHHLSGTGLGLGGDKEILITGNAGKRIAYGIIVQYKK